MKIEIILIQITKHFIYKPIQLTNILLKVQIVILYKKGVFSFKKMYYFCSALVSMSVVCRHWIKRETGVSPVQFPLL